MRWTKITIDEKNAAPTFTAMIKVIQEEQKNISDTKGIADMVSWVITDATGRGNQIPGGGTRDPLFLRCTLKLQRTRLLGPTKKVV